MLALQLSASMLFAIAGQSAPAQPATPPAPTSAPVEAAEGARVANADSEKKICKSVEVLGTRIPQRACHTKAEWDQMARETAEAKRSSRNSSSTCGDGSFC